MVSIVMFVEKREKFFKTVFHTVVCFDFLQRTDSYNNVARFPKLWEGGILKTWGKKIKNM